MRNLCPNCGKELVITYKFLYPKYRKPFSYLDFVLDRIEPNVMKKHKITSCPDNIPETFWKWAKNCYETIELE